jgi:hypothetical protein
MAPVDASALEQQEACSALAVVYLFDLVNPAYQKLWNSVVNAEEQRCFLPETAWPPKASSSQKPDGQTGFTWKTARV